MQELKTSVNNITAELTGKSVTIFFEPDFITLTGRWYWDFVSDAVFCSNVMLSFPQDFGGTKGIIHPDDVERVKSKLELDEIRHLEFRIITTYGEVRNIVGCPIHLSYFPIGHSHKVLSPYSHARPNNQPVHLSK